MFSLFGEPITFYCIYMPIVSVVIASVIVACLGAEQGDDVSNLPSVVTGIVLILASLIFRYGAELEKRSHARVPDGDEEGQNTTRKTVWF